ncbi:hypothetical protein CDEST_01980 [Colletotrichum destructivum]|uniref:Uncharacterized protein n=1 Tax=Colletotrichum destructivum TaxID=34406 RepID=A0AAX4I183_9PEZI|nr:hypothetical protein CDEST_01980 [Colletotrichum destructivum]
MQTDDTIDLTGAPFDAKEEKSEKVSFTAKAKQHLTVHNSLTSNGVIVLQASSTGTTIIQRQEGQQRKLQLVDAKSPTDRRDYVQ